MAVPFYRSFTDSKECRFFSRVLRYVCMFPGGSVFVYNMWTRLIVYVHPMDTLSLTLMILQDGLSFRRRFVVCPETE